MERTIDRTSYRRSARQQVTRVEKEEVNSFGYVKTFLNQIIVSLLIIIVILISRYFEVTQVDDWLKSNASGGYEISEVLHAIIGDFKKDNIVFVSGDNSSGDVSGESGEKILGDVTFKTAVEGVNQMSEDARIIKENYEIILPVNGIVTSNFGCRISNNEKISKYHTGLDIAAEKGSKIKAAHSGIITLSQEISGYGNCIIITNGDLTSLYAHCSSLNVNKGQSVKKGDYIGDVGMTGNATGPHLHLEFKYQDRFVDPKDVLGEI